MALNDGDIQATLDAHNQWRNKYGVPALVWDASLATDAQTWADQMASSGSFDHSQNGHGENIFMSSAASTPQAVVDSWGSEEPNYDIGSDTCAPGQECGHFTQLIWRTTTKVGCGRATGPDGEYWCCDYDPPGNITGVRPLDS
jgi:pathogenesis-related protein 1